MTTPPLALVVSAAALDEEEEEEEEEEEDGEKGSLPEGTVPSASASSTAESVWGKGWMEGTE